MPYPRISTFLNNNLLNAALPSISLRIHTYAALESQQRLKEWDPILNQYEVFKKEFLNFYLEEDNDPCFNWQAFSKWIRSHSFYENELILGPILRAFVSKNDSSKNSEPYRLLTPEETEAYLYAPLGLAMQICFTSSSNIIPPVTMNSFFPSPSKTLVCVYFYEGHPYELQPPNTLGEATLNYNQEVKKLPSALAQVHRMLSVDTSPISFQQIATAFTHLKSYVVEKLKSEYQLTVHDPSKIFIARSEHSSSPSTSSNSSCPLESGEIMLRGAEHLLKKFKLKIRENKKLRDYQFYAEAVFRILDHHPIKEVHFDVFFNEYTLIDLYEILKKLPPKLIEDKEIIDKILMHDNKHFLRLIFHSLSLRLLSASLVDFILGSEDDEILLYQSEIISLLDERGILQPSHLLVIQHYPAPRALKYVLHCLREVKLKEFIESILTHPEIGTLEVILTRIMWNCLDQQLFERIHGLSLPEQTKLAQNLTNEPWETFNKKGIIKLVEKIESSSPRLKF